MVAQKISCIIDLPENFRPQEFLEFHGRDITGLSENIKGTSLHKGMAWEGRPACLAIKLSGQHAEIAISIDQPATALITDTLKTLAERMLGLTQPIEEFEKTYRKHPQIGTLITAHPGLRVPLAATPFEALTWAVTGQQISLNAAIALRRKLIMAAGLRHSGGLACYPDARAIAGLGMGDLRQAGFSQTKAQTLMTLGPMVVENTLPLDAWLMGDVPIDSIREQLLNIRGVGPWTVSYALLRGFGWLDGSLHGDAAMRRNLQSLLNVKDKIDEAFTRDWLADFSPWRSLVSAHLWAMKKSLS